MEDKNFRRRLISNSQDAIHLPAGYKKLKYIYGLGGSYTRIHVPKPYNKEISWVTSPSHMHFDFGCPCLDANAYSLNMLQCDTTKSTVYDIEVYPDSDYKDMLYVDVNVPFKNFVEYRKIPYVGKNALTKKGTILAYAGAKDDYTTLINNDGGDKNKNCLVPYNDAYYACFQHGIIDTHRIKNGDESNYTCTWSDEFNTYPMNYSASGEDPKVSSYDEVTGIIIELDDKLFFNLMFYYVNYEDGKKTIMMDLIPCYNTTDKTYGVFDTVNQKFYAADNQNKMFGGNSLLVYSGGGNS